MSAKQRVLQAVRAVPDECTISEIAEVIAILAAIERGEDDIAAGRSMAHEEVVNQARRWKTTK